LLASTVPTGRISTETATSIPAKPVKQPWVCLWPTLILQWP